MTTATYYDNVAETTDTTGTGTLTLTNTAVSGSRVFPAAADAKTIVFGIKHSNGTDWEVSTGTYTNTGRTLTRTLSSSSTGSLLNLSGTGHEVAIVAEATRMNKLEKMVDFSDEVSITGTTSLTATAFGRMHVCTGTTADYTITLPTAVGNTGKMIGFQMGDSTALTKLITLDGNSTETIDELTTRVYWDNEVVVIKSDGSDYVIVHQKLIPKKLAQLTMSGASAQSINSGAWTAVNYIDTGTYGSDPYDIWDNTNKYFTPPRPGKYLCKCSLSYASGAWAAGKTSRLRVNSTNYVYQQMSFPITTAFTGVLYYTGFILAELENGETNIPIQTYQDSGSTLSLVLNNDNLVHLIWIGE